MSSVKLWMSGLVSALVVVLWAAPGWTCMEPTAQFQLDGETVPSTVQGALFRNCNNIAPLEDPEFGLYVDDSDQAVEITAEQDRDGLYEIFFEEELMEHTTYRFESDPECREEGPPEPASWTFETGESAELPEDIGVWVPQNPVVGPVRHEGDGDELCSQVVEGAYQRLEFEPTEEAEVWGEAIAFESWVNSSVWEPQAGVNETAPAGASRVGWGEEQVYAVCEGDGPEPREFAETLEDGFFRIEISARIPGTDAIWTSEAHTDVMSCPDEDEDEEEDEDDDGDGDEDREDEESEDSPEVGEDEPTCSQVGTNGSGGTAAVVLLGLLLWRRRD